MVVMRSNFKRTMTTGKKIILSSVGHYHPENKVENSFFEELEIGSDGGWVAEKTGIKSRRSVLKIEDILSLRKDSKNLSKLREENRIMSIAEMSAKAWQVASSRYDSAATGVDLLICGTSIPDYDIPSNGCTVAKQIGIECSAIDVNSACSSFVVDLHIARSLLQADTHKKIAIFNPERYTLRLDYNDRASCVLFGDGCSAAVLESGECGCGFELIDTIIAGNPSKWDLVQIPDDRVFFQNGKAVQKFAITKTIEVTEQILERNKLNISDVGFFIGHQANYRMLTSCVEKLGLDSSKHLFNVDNFGNQGGAGAPSVLSMNWDKFKSGDVVVISVVGSGLTWASALLRKI